MPAAVFSEWLNANSTRNYPIQEGLGREAIQGGFVIPNNFLLAAQINIPRDYVEGTFFIQEVGSFADSSYLVIGYLDSLLEVSKVANISINHSDHSYGKYYSFVGLDEFYSVVGSIAIGDVDLLKSRGLGSFSFESSQASFEPSCLFVSVPAVKAVEVYSGSSLVHVATDVLRLKAGENIRLTYVDDSPDHIRIDAVPGENVLEPDECENSPYAEEPCIRTINGIPPDENGDFKIFGSDCIRIDPGTNSISIHDLCSVSCCGCNELEELVDGLAAVKAEEDNIRTMLSLVQSTQADMITKLVSQVVPIV
jgi:hypothetical protein